MNGLKHAGVKIDERQKLNYMLKTLPDSLSFVGVLINAIQESDKNCEFIKNNIKVWESRINSETGKQNNKCF